MEEAMKTGNLKDMIANLTGKQIAGQVPKMLTFRQIQYLGVSTQHKIMGKPLPIFDFSSARWKTGFT